jgi:2-keto-4-pentenoate hydratase/2-oxohepta-3-ene-1,7-dioic acid hydratase in catechol pathway
MMLASVRKAGRDTVAVAVGQDRVLEIAVLLAIGGQPEAEPPRSMRHLIDGGALMLERLRTALADADPAEIDARSIVPEAWYPPIRSPGKILAVAMNNSASNARKISAPGHPAFFLKPPSCLIGHLEPIRIRSYYGSVHPEPELAVVIGSKLRDLPATEALDAVFGYTIFDDITGNGMRAEDRFHYWAIYASKDDPDKTEKVEQHLSYAARYKGTDNFGVLGPWLVTRDEIADPDALDVRCTIHGEVIAEDSTRYYNYKVAEVLSFISYFQTLYPGDIVSLGTAFKPGATRKSIHQADLQRVPGPIEISIAGLGTQSSPVEVESRELGPWRLP